MEIHALKLVVTDVDLNELARKQLPKGAPVRNLRVRIEDGLLRVGGDYRGMLIPVPFDTAWELSVRERRVCVRLAGVTVVGLPVNMLRGMILSGFARLAAKEASVRVEGDTLLVDVDGLMQAHGVLLRTNLKSIRCLPGQIVLEA